MRAIEEELVHLRDADCNVLILGETGTGKSVLARRVHALSVRSTGPFVDVNCAGLASDFVQSELFGHERGSFTGAYATTTGLLDAANGGTLFLDEIGDMDLRVQPKLLKVLEEKRFRRIGDHREREVDVRLVSATHCDLHAAMDRGSFRADLFYRIGTVTLVMPSLRERVEDIVPLAEELLARMDATSDRLTPLAHERLTQHRWPGNLRELKSVLERALLRCRGRAICADDLLFAGKAPAPATAPASAVRIQTARGVDAPDDARLEEVEREHILLALETEGGSIQRTARRLGIARSTLYAKLRLYAITLDDVRSSAARARAATGS